MVNLIRLPVVLGLALGVAHAHPRTSAPLPIPKFRSITALPAATLGTRLAPASFGRSGSLRVLVVNPGERLNLQVSLDGAEPAAVQYRWIPVHGTRSVLPISEHPFTAGLRAPIEAGVWRLRLRAGDLQEEIHTLQVIVRVPVDQKRAGTLNGYRIGTYATEGVGRTDNYAPPPGFIEVNPDNQHLQISEHFRLGQFLTKNQFAIWPKYVALDLRLIDKLELVMQELNAMGIPAHRMVVMSGFRTPEYNGPGGDGRAQLSRHTYGDASDVWIDNDGDNYIDDLNGDGLRDATDAALMRIAVDRVERRFPELTGGNGVYTSTPAHGPFIHIDVRGSASRW